MPRRIYDIAKKLGLENREVIAKAKQLGIAAARVASSSLDNATADRLEEALLVSYGAERERGLRGFSLGNFKAFADTQSIPIRPLTLIFGANSSGKSSIIHGLLLAREAVQRGKLDVFKTRVGGDAVDLGGFRQYVHRREGNRRVEWAAELRTENLQGNAFAVLGASKRLKVGLFFGTPLDDAGLPQPGSLPRLVTYEVEADGRLSIRLSYREDGTMRVDRLDLETFKPLVRALVVSATTTESVTPEDETTITRALEELLPTLRIACENLLPEQLVGHDYGDGAMQQLLGIRKEQRQEQLASATRRYIPGAIVGVVSGVNAALRALLERVVYLGPLRSFPPRHLAFVEQNDPNWFAGGGYAWDMVRRDEKLREKVNGWLGSERLQTRYELTVERLFRRSDTASGIEGGLGSIAADMERKMQAASDEDHHFPFDNLWDEAEYTRWLMEAIRVKSADNVVDELILIDRRTNTPVTHRDVGIGISQVLPVLVHAYADKGQLVAIEQPEIHLHPALQAELGEVFIESALGENKNTFLLETHSEHLILRILHRVRQTTEKNLPAGAMPVRPEDITVVFVEPTAKGSVVRHLPVTPDGDFGAPWPGGFFADRLADLP